MVHAHPDTLLIDEVFAVGDQSFQKKCMDKMNQFRREKRTIIFVSHDLNALRSICDRCLLLESGRVVSIGEINTTIDDYLARLEGDR